MGGPPQPHLLRPDPLPPSATAFSVPSSLNSLNTRRRSQRLRPLPLSQPRRLSQSARLLQLSQLLRRASLWLPPLLPQQLSQLRPPRHQSPTERPRLPPATRRPRSQSLHSPSSVPPSRARPLQKPRKSARSQLPLRRPSQLQPKPQSLRPQSFLSQPQLFLSRLPRFLLPHKHHTIHIVRNRVIS